MMHAYCTCIDWIDGSECMGVIGASIFLHNDDVNLKKRATGNN